MFCLMCANQCEPELLVRGYALCPRCTRRLSYLGSKGLSTARRRQLIRLYCLGPHNL